MVLNPFERKIGPVQIKTTGTPEFDIEAINELMNQLAETKRDQEE